ncbi:putative quinol monooxygenase [Sphingomonas sp. GlSt437]|uniref:putative quinol monooxygenase n=1 Tax=Sphingomonas sp. GlSt437 TaxID=3389970 RepID=UPI003A8AA4D2
MIIVIGSVTARPDSFDALLQASLDHVHRSRGEPGCISHAVHIDAENPMRLFFFERWTDMAALHTHFAVPGSIEFIGKVRALAAASESVTLYEADERTA